MKNTERVSYIRGLAEGLELDENKKEVKVINAIIDLLDDLTFSMSQMEDNMNDMADQLDAVDEDLGSVEDDFYDVDEEDEDNEGDSCYYEVTCPHCHETICLSKDLVEDGEMECPNCGEKLEFDLPDESGEEDKDSENAEECCNGEDCCCQRDKD